MADGVEGQDGGGGDLAKAGWLQSLRATMVSSPWARWLVILGGAILVLVVPLGLNSYWTRVLVQAELGVMMGLGLNVIVGYTGLLNLGYIAYFAIGAYAYAILASPHVGIHMPFVLVLPLGGLLAGVVGALLALPALPLRGDYLALVTLGFGEITRLVANNLKLTGAAAGIMAIDHPRVFFWEVVSAWDYYYLALGFCVIEVFLMLRLERSRIGRAWIAIREDEAAARAMGINTTRMKLLASAIGAVPAGLAGVVFAGLMTFVSPVSFTMTESVGVLSAVIVGGLGSVPGVVLGAVLLNVLPEPLRQYTEAYRMLLYALLLGAFTLFRPQGIWPAQYSYRGLSKEGFLGGGEGAEAVGTDSVERR